MNDPKFFLMISLKTPMLVVTLNQSNAQLTTALYSRAKNEDENNSFIIDVNRWEWAINWRFQNIKS